MATLNFVEGTGIAVQAGPNPADADVTDVEISSTLEIPDAAPPFDPATATSWWMPLADSDGLLVLDSDGALIPTLITL